MGLGVVPAALAADGTCRGAYEVGWVYDPVGYYWDRDDYDARFDEGYGTGDRVTVILNLDANTVAFRKNDVDAGSQKDIAHGYSSEAAFRFAFEAYYNRIAVTIVKKE